MLNLCTISIYMKTKLPYLQFGMMPRSGDMVSFGDKLLLYGKPGQAYGADASEPARIFSVSLPNRILFTIVFICRAGGIRLRCNLRDYDIGAGELLVVVPNTIVESLDILPSSEILCMAISDDSYAPAMTQFHSAYRRSRFVSPVVVKAGEEFMEEAVSVYSHLWHMLDRFPEKMDDDLVKAYMQVMSGLVAAGVGKGLESGAGEPLSAADNTLKAFLSALAEDYAEHRDVAYYAGLVCLSPKYFAKSVLKSSGRHPLDWIRGYVILEAKTMLRSGDYSVQQVCDALNFPSVSHFVRYFRNASGTTPNKYRSLGRESSEGRSEGQAEQPES